MANVEKLSISLPSDLVEYIKDSVGSGSYSTASEFLRETLRERRRRENRGALPCPPCSRETRPT